MSKIKRISLKLLLAIFILIIIIALSYFIYQSYFKENDSIVTAFQTEGIHLIIEDQIIVTKNRPKVIDEEILMPIEIIREYFDKDIYWDEGLKKVTITTKNRVIRMKTNDLEAIVNNNPVNLNIPAKEDDGTVYIPIEFLGDFYNIDIKYIKKNNVIIIDPISNMIQVAEPIFSYTVIRTGKSKREPIIKILKGNDIDGFNSDEEKISNNAQDKSNKTNVNKSNTSDGKDGNTLRIFKEYEDWYKVRTQEGELGYVEKKHVVVKWITVNRDTAYQRWSDEVWKPDKGKINLVWEMMYGQRPNLDRIGKIEGLDVISPTWFELKDYEGNIINRADATYVEWAHKNGYKIWALFSNNFQDIKGTSTFLNNTDYRDNAIRQILTYAFLYKLDGINLDFENVYKEDKDALSQFVRELTPFLREQGLTVSIDVNVVGGSDTWSKCYDHKALGEIVDYIMLMAYDQHWGTSPIAGSVAQVSWVESNVVKVLDLVPREKLLLGLPFYTRLWKEEKMGGAAKVTNPKVLTMESARKMINDNDSSVEWDEKSGQFYTEFKDDGKSYKIWLEDENSINLKSALVHKYKLAGTAAWRRSDESPEVWDILNKNLKIVRNYQEWQEIYNVKNFVYNK